MVSLRSAAGAGGRQCQQVTGRTSRAAGEEMVSKWFGSHDDVDLGSRF